MGLLLQLAYGQLRYAACVESILRVAAAASCSLTEATPTGPEL